MIGYNQLTVSEAMPQLSPHQNLFRSSDLLCLQLQTQKSLAAFIEIIWHGNKWFVVIYFILKILLSHYVASNSRKRADDIHKKDGNRS